MARRGRPGGSIIPLLSDRRRFEVAIWFVCTECLGFGPYEAAYLAAFLVSDQPITTESVEEVLLKSSTLPMHSPMVTLKGRADWIRHKASRAIKRARTNEREWAWLTMSLGLICAALQLGESDEGGLHIALKMLRQAGWGDTLDLVGRRIEASLSGNFPPAEDKPSRKAARLLGRVKKAVS